jgi:hypothetical protein
LSLWVGLQGHSASSFKSSMHNVYAELLHSIGVWTFSHVSHFLPAFQDSNEVFHHACYISAGLWNWGTFQDWVTSSFFLSNMQKTCNRSTSTSDCSLFLDLYYFLVHFNGKLRF